MALSPLRKLVTAIVFELQGEEAANNAVNALRSRLEQVSAAANTVSQRLSSLGAEHTRLTQQQLSALSSLSEADKARAHAKDLLMTRLAARQKELADRAAERELNSYAREEAQERRRQERLATAQAREKQREETAAARQRVNAAKAEAAAADRAARKEERAARAAEAQARREAQIAERAATSQARQAEREEQRLTRAQAQREAIAARAAAKKAADDEKGLRAQLRLMDRYSAGQARIDRQVMREKERAAQNEARLIAAREREQRANERRDEQEGRRAQAEQRRILREREQAARRSAQAERRMLAEAYADNRRFDADRLRSQRNAVAATRSQEAEKRRALRETEMAHSRASSEARESLHSVMHFGTALGLLYTGHQLIHMADEWSFVTATIKNSTNGVQEYGTALNGLMAISQRAGVGIEAPLRLFNQLAANRSETHLGQNDILDITDTVTRGIALNHGTNAQNLRAMRQFDEMLSQGRLSRQHMNSLRVDNPYLANIMAQAAGGQRHLDDDIHNRKADLNYIIELVRKMRVIVDHDFGHVQTTFGMAAARIRNAFMQLMGEFIIDNHTLSTGLDVVTGAVERLIHGVEAAAHAVGGFDQAAKLAGIAFAAIVGPSVISAVIALGAALLPLVLPWAAMAAGIATVLLLLDDLYGWANGKDSILGMLFGDFDQYREQLIAIKDALLDAFGLSDAMRNVHSVRDALHTVLDMMTGLAEDPAKHWTLVSQLHDALETIEQILKDVKLVSLPIRKAYNLTTGWMDYVPTVGTWLHDNAFSREGMGKMLNGMSALGATPLYPAPPEEAQQRSAMSLRHVYDGLGQFVVPEIGRQTSYITQGTTGPNYLSALKPVINNGDTHIDASVTVNARTGASPREIADTVGNRQTTILRNVLNQASRKTPVSFPVAEAGVVSQ